MKKNQITVAVVCLNEEKNIGGCLRSIISQILKPHQILVIDNNSSDKTVSIVKNYQRRAKNIKLIINKIRSISKSRNIAVKHCSSSFLAFTDADCRASPDWLSRLWQGYDRFKKIHPEIAACGGANIPPNTSFFYQLLRLFLDSILGTGSSIQGRIYPDDHLVPHIPGVNILLEKKKITEIGGYDETFGSIIEDEDLTARLKERGYKFAYIADASVKHYLAPSFWIWAKKMIVYGKGRMWFVRKYPEKISLKSTIPLILVLSPLLFFFFPKVTINLLICYLLLTFFFSIYRSFKSRRYFYFLPLFFLYLLSHFLYGCGELYGLFVKRPTTNIIDSILSQSSASTRV